MSIAFKKAEKKQSKLRLVFTGPSGSGKTHSALLVMAGIVGPNGRIAVIDTENGRASLKVGEPEIPEFDTLQLKPPYGSDRYIEAVNAAVEAGYDGLIIDSTSHQWAGEGGILSRKEQVDARGGNSFTNWAPFTKEHERFKAALLNADVHLIVTVRAKQEYVMEANDKGKSAPKKVGVAPIQREGLEYEFSFHFDLAMNHEAKVMKTDDSRIDGGIFIPTRNTGIDLMAWLNNGVAMMTRAQAAEIDALRKEKNMPLEDLFSFLKVERLGEVAANRLPELRAWIAAYQPKAAPAQASASTTSALPAKSDEYDKEVEAYIQAGLTMDVLWQYVQTLPFANDLPKVAENLRVTRECYKAAVLPSVIKAAIDRAKQMAVKS